MVPKIFSRKPEEFEEQRFRNRAANWSTLGDAARVAAAGLFIYGAVNWFDGVTDGSSNVPAIMQEAGEEYIKGLPALATAGLCKVLGDQSKRQSQRYKDMVDDE